MDESGKHLIKHAPLEGTHAPDLSSDGYRYRAPARIAEHRAIDLDVPCRRHPGEYPDVASLVILKDRVFYRDDICSRDLQPTLLGKEAYCRRRG